MQLDKVSALISQELKAMARVNDPQLICSRRKAITALFPYVIWQERDGQHEMLDIFLHVARASQEPRFIWCWITPFIATLLDKESPISLKQAAILVSPHLLWWGSSTGKHMIQLWAIASLDVPYTDDIGHSVVDTLLRIASNASLGPHIPTWMWLWLGRCLYLPPICTGRYLGSDWGVVRAIRALGDVEILKSYLLLIWSEWDYLYHEGYHEMCTLIREDFSGVWMRCHREDLLQRLDHILGQLDLGLEHLQQHKPSLDEDALQQMKKQYGKLKKVVLKEDRGAIIALTCKPSRLSALFSLLTLANTYRSTLNIHVCTSSSMSLTSLLPPLRNSIDYPTLMFPLISCVAYHTLPLFLSF